MNLKEYEQVKDFNYLEYCDYLQQKYGIGKSDYMTKAYNKNSKVTRTSEGLLAHHKFEDHAAMLADKNIAMQNPFEWQKAENIVYCDYLEHLFLHILIDEYPGVADNGIGGLGLGGAVNFIIPELNDFYSGWQTMQQWRKACHDKIKDDKEVYLALIKRLKQHKHNPVMMNRWLHSSFNAQFGYWSEEKNQELFKEIEKL